MNSMFLKKFKKILNVLLAISNIIAALIYFLGNFHTIMVYFYRNNEDRLRSNLDYYIDKYEGKNGSGIFNFFWDRALWFEDQDRSMILFIIISIFMLLSILIMPKNKKISKILIVYYIICFFLMEFITFIEIPYLLNWYYD